MTRRSGPPVRKRGGISNRRRNPLRTDEGARSRRKPNLEERLFRIFCPLDAFCCWHIIFQINIVRVDRVELAPSICVHQDFIRFLNALEECIIVGISLIGFLVGVVLEDLFTVYTSP